MNMPQSRYDYRCRHCHEKIGSSLADLGIQSFAVFDMRKLHSIRDKCGPLYPSFNWVYMEKVDLVKSNEGGES